MAGWYEELNALDTDQQAVERPVRRRGVEGYLQRRGLRLTERGEVVRDSVVLFALLLAGVALLWLWEAGATAATGVSG